MYPNHKEISRVHCHLPLSTGYCEGACIAMKFMSSVMLYPAYGKWETYTSHDGRIPKYLRPSRHATFQVLRTKQKLLLLETVDVKFQVADVGDEAEFSEPLSALHCPPSRHQPQQASEVHIPRQWQPGSLVFDGMDWTGKIICGGNVEQGLAKSEDSCAAPFPCSKAPKLILRGIRCRFCLSSFLCEQCDLIKKNQ